MPDNEEAEPHLKRGWARMRELDQADAVERDALETELLGYLGRTPVAIDRIAVETLVASVVRARRLRARGKSDAEERKIILQSIRATGIRPPPAGSGDADTGPSGLFIDDDDADENDPR